MFNFLSKNIFKINWKQNFEYPIWKIFPSSQNIILCETRDIENKITKYHSIDLNTGKFIWQNYFLDNNWWMGVEGVYGDVILFHEYERPDFPIHKSIIAVDLFNHSVLWQLKDVKFVSATVDFVFATSSNIEQQIFYQINIKSGDIIKNLSYEEMKLITSQIIENNRNLHFPDSLDMEEIRKDNIIRYFSNINKNIFKVVDILQSNQLNIIGFSVEQYVNGKALFDDYISIIDLEAKQLYIDKLFTNGNQVVSPRFYMDNGFLIYIKNKFILNAIMLQ